MEVILVGYSGHAYVVIDIMKRCNWTIKGYTELRKKELNPFVLEYLGNDANLKEVALSDTQYFFVGLGENKLRYRLYHKFIAKNYTPANPLIDPSSIIGTDCRIGNGTVIMPKAVVNALASVGNGCIINTGAILEHECKIADFVHLAPGSVLAGNVKVGEQTFIGAGAVVREGITIGKHVVIGAGSVVVKDIPDGQIVKGVPAK